MRRWFADVSWVAYAGIAFQLRVVVAGLVRWWRVPSGRDAATAGGGAVPDTDQFGIGGVCSSAAGGPRPV
jgi:hypothetical protein